MFLVVVTPFHPSFISSVCLQALALTKYLLCNGPDVFIEDCKQRKADIAHLRKYKHYNEQNEDVAKDARNRVPSLSAVLILGFPRIPVFNSDQQTNSDGAGVGLECNCLAGEAAAAAVRSAARHEPWKR